MPLLPPVATSLVATSLVATSLVSAVPLAAQDLPQARFVPLGVPGTEPGGAAAGSGLASFANALDEDGSVVVGVSTATYPTEAVRWLVGGAYETFAQPGPFAQPTTALYVVSADGSVVAGTQENDLHGWPAFRVDADGGWSSVVLSSAYNNVTGMSADGSVLSVSTVNPDVGQNFGWVGSPEEGFVRLPPLPGGQDLVQANGISADGEAVVGDARSGTNATQAFRWTRPGGTEPIAAPTSRALDASADGSVVVGEAGSVAFRWTEAAGAVSLGTLPGDLRSVAHQVSDDGQTIVGSSGVETAYDTPFLWRADLGLVPVQEHLVAAGASCLEGWTLRSAVLSADGNALAGHGTNPAGQSEAWVAYLEAPAWLAPSVPASEVVQLGDPPNPSALLPGRTTPPYAGAHWDPVVDHAVFAADASFDVLLVSARPVELPLGDSGTLLCGPPWEVFSVAAGEPFDVPVPNRCALVGSSLCAQAAALFDGPAPPLLTNALEVTIGGL